MQIFDFYFYYWNSSTCKASSRQGALWELTFSVVFAPVLNVCWGFSCWTFVLGWLFFSVCGVVLVGMLLLQPQGRTLQTQLRFDDWRTALQWYVFCWDSFSDSNSYVCICKYKSTVWTIWSFYELVSWSRKGYQYFGCDFQPYWYTDLIKNYIDLENSYYIL